MERLDVTSIANAVYSSATPEQAWSGFAAALTRQGLPRTALVSGLPLAAANPFAHDQCERVFGTIWSRQFEDQLRYFRGDVRRAHQSELLGVKPMLILLSVARSTVVVENMRLAGNGGMGPIAKISRQMIDLHGQYQMAVFPLLNPSCGKAGFLCAWGDEDRPDFSAFVNANSSALHMAGHFFLAAVDARWPTESVTVDRDRGPVGRLSGREREVLGLFAKGAQTAEVADRLGISERTVREYVTRARAKLDARSRSGAIAKAVIAGFV